MTRVAGGMTPVPQRTAAPRRSRASGHGRDSGGHQGVPRALPRLMEHEGDLEEGPGHGYDEPGGGRGSAPVSSGYRPRGEAGFTENRQGAHPEDEEADG